MKKNNVLTIQGNGFSWEFDKKKGKLSGAKVSGEEILKDGVELMILGNKTNKCEPEASLHVPFFNSVCAGWELHNYTWLVQNDSVIVTVTGSYNEANVEIQYAFSDDAKLKVSYLLKSKIQITPRQVGLVFSVPSGFDNLEWERKGLWSCYPEDHIGRNSGKAKAFGEIRLSGVSLEKPQHGWRFDANDLGCNDFRATRENIYWATLSSDKGTGILILSDGAQAFRSFVNEGNINFLVADYSSGGGDLFILKRDGLDSLKLEDGTEYSGSATIQLIGLITKK